MSTTGLSTVNVSEVLSTTGQVILSFIIQFGGIGLIMLLASFWIISGKSISFKERQYIVTDQNQVKASKVVKLVKDVLVILFTIEFVMFLIMGFYLYMNDYLLVFR